MINGATHYFFSGEIIMDKLYTLGSLSVGESGRVVALPDGFIKKRLEDVGLAEGTPVRCVGKNPCGDMRAYLIRGAVIAIRRQDCEGIRIQKEGDRHGID